MIDLINDVLKVIGAESLILFLWVEIFGGEFKVTLYNPFCKEYWRKKR